MDSWNLPADKNTNLDKIQCFQRSAFYHWNVKYVLFKQRNWMPTWGRGKNFPEQLFQLSICLIRALPLCWSTDRHITDPFPCAGVSAEHSTPLSTPVMYWQNPECSIERSNKADTKIYGTLKTGWGWNCHNSSRGFKITFKIDSNRAELEKYFSHKLHVVKTKSW